MSISRSTASPRFGAEDARPLIGRHLASLAGLAIIAAVILVAAALATWTVTDASVNNAVAGPVSNILGFPGASVADLLMQGFGLAGPLLLVPPVFWGWRLIAGRRPGTSPARLLVWVLSAVLAAGALSTLTRPEGWPLPTGLGGIVGDVTLMLPFLFISAEDTTLRLVVLALLGIAAAATLLLAIGRSRPAVPPRLATLSEDDLVDDDEDEDAPGRFEALHGALTHWRLMASAKLRRILPTGRRAEEPDFGAYAEPRRHEPALASDGGERSRLSRVLKSLGDEDDGLPLDARHEPRFGADPEPVSPVPTLRRPATAAAPVAPVAEEKPRRRINIETSPAWQSAPEVDAGDEDDWQDTPLMPEPVPVRRARPMEADAPVAYQPPAYQQPAAYQPVEAVAVAARAAGVAAGAMMQGAAMGSAAAATASAAGAVGSMAAAAVQAPMAARFARNLAEARAAGRTAQAHAPSQAQAHSAQAHAQAMAPAPAPVNAAPQPTLHRPAQPAPQPMRAPAPPPQPAPARRTAPIPFPATSRGPAALLRRGVGPAAAAAAAVAAAPAVARAMPAPLPEPEPDFETAEQWFEPEAPAPVSAYAPPAPMPEFDGHDPALDGADDDYGYDVSDFEAAQAAPPAPVYQPPVDTGFQPALDDDGYPDDEIDTDFAAALQPDDAYGAAPELADDDLSYPDDDADADDGFDVPPGSHTLGQAPMGFAPVPVAPRPQQPQAPVWAGRPEAGGLPSAALPSRGPAAPPTQVHAPAPPMQAMRGPMGGGRRSMNPDGHLFEFPPINILATPRPVQRGSMMTPDALEQNARLLEGVLEDFGVRGEIVNVRPGPVVTLYELEPAPGIKSARVIGLAEDVARSMCAISARIAVIPGKNAIGIEMPNQTREMVYLRELIGSQEYDATKARLPLCLGKTIGGEPVIADLARMPHLLVAGTTGSGKSVAINTMILSLLYRMRPDQCRLIMVDPKMLELSVYDGIPHLLTPVVTDPKKALVALKWAVREMEDRYRKMSKLGVRNIDGYNQRVSEALAKGEALTRTVQTGFNRETGEPIFEHETLDLGPIPYIVVIVDEMADLMMVAGKEIEGAVQRLAQMARAAGIHVVLATQRPSVDVITGTIKANFPTRISFQVTSKIDSRTILGEQGAEQLLGQGDMLYMAGGGRIQRVHGPFVSDDEVEKIVAHLKTQGAPDYLDQITQDEEEEAEASSGTQALDESNDLYDRAVAVILRDRKASTSYIQRRLQIGYNRAASLIERMEQEGLVGPANSTGKREILVEAREDEDDPF